MTSVHSNQQMTTESPFFESASYYVFLNDMQSIVKHSFLVHRSVACLDLNLSEFSRSKYENLVKAERIQNKLMLKSDFICTQESSKKNLAKNRKVMYTYHLDVTAELESGDLEFDKIKDYLDNYNGALLNKIIIFPGLYERRLNELIIAHLLKTQEAKFAKSVLKVMEFVNLPGNTSYLLNRCLEILYSQSDDSNIIEEFSETVRLQKSDLFFIKPQILEFFLRHGYCKDNNELQRRLEWINYCISICKFEHVTVLLKYYNAPRFSESAYRKTKHSLRIASALTEVEMERAVQLGWITKERNLLILQTFDIFYSSEFSLFENSRLRTSGSEALRMMWSSVPDILISQEELALFYGNTRIRRDIKRILAFYGRIVQEDTKDRKPRKLKDYCRIVVRNILCANERLPEGIGQLSLPNLVQSFLKLEQTWLR